MLPHIKSPFQIDERRFCALSVSSLCHFAFDFPTVLFFCPAVVYHQVCPLPALVETGSQ